MSSSNSRLWRECFTCDYRKRASPTRVQNIITVSQGLLGALVDVATQRVRVTLLVDLSNNNSLNSCGVQESEAARSNKLLAPDFLVPNRPENLRQRGRSNTG